MASFVISGSSTTPQTLTGGETGVVAGPNSQLVVSGDAITTSGGGTNYIYVGGLVMANSVSAADGAIVATGFRTEISVGPGGVLQALNDDTVSMRLTGGASLLNAGAILSGEDAVDIRTEDGGTLTYISNSGLMQGDSDGLAADSGTNFLYMVNTGTIIGQSGFGIFANWQLSSTGTAYLKNGGTIIGVSGSYTAFSGLGVNIIENAGLMVGDIFLDDNDDVYRGTSGEVQGTVYGDQDNDLLIGGNAVDLFDGGIDDDTLIGHGGDDNLVGSSGNDVLLGGAGNDMLSGGDNDDTINGNSGDDTLEGGTGNDILVGQDGSDEIDGDMGSDHMIGGDGDDLLTGGSDNDTLNGGAGADELFGDAGDDILIGGDGDDVLDGGENDDTIDGGAGDDQIEGGDGDDIMRGRAGEDQFKPGLGRDVMTGGEGVDTFIFATTAIAGTGVNRDVIQDFEQSIDLINVVAMAPGAFDFIGTSGFSGTGVEIRVTETAAGTSIVEFDADGDGTADAQLKITGVLGLTADDFAL